MAGPTVAERRGEEKAMSAAEAQGLMTTIDTQLEAARKYARQTALHLPTGGATAESINAPLIKSLQALNNGVRSYNPVKEASGRGKDFVEVPQANAVLDTAALDRIKMQVVLAANAPNRASLANDIVSAAPADTARAQADTLPKVPAKVEAPQPAAALKATPQPVVQQLTQEERDNYQRIADNLDRIYRTAQGRTKTDAILLRDRISPFINKTGATQAEVDATRATLRKLEAEYNNNTSFAAALKAAQDAELAAAPAAAGISVKEAPKHPLQQQLVETQAMLQKIPQGDARRQLAEMIINELPGVWLLGEETKAGGRDEMGTGPRWEAYAMLKAAMVTLVEGNQEVAKTNYDAAISLFSQEQELLGRRVKALRAEVDGAVSAVKASRLATGSQLLGEEKAEGIGTKNEAGRIYRTSGRGIHNGREDIEAAMVNRQQQVAALSQSGGRLSYQQVSDLEQTVRAEAGAVRTLIAFWHALQGGQTGWDEAERKAAWKHYGAAAATLADPDPATAVIVYNSYSKEMRAFMVEQYRKATGDNASSEQKIIAALMRSPQWRYDDALYGVYQHAYVLAPPVPAELQEVVGLISGLRAARVYYEDAYEQYVTMENKDPDQRLEDARFFLQNARDMVVNTGAPANDILLVSADLWLLMEGPVEKKGKEAMADYIYNVAVSMVAVREAEVWANNARSIGRPGITAETIVNAKQTAATAKREFGWYFSVPEAQDVSYYPNLPRTVADGAIRAVAPDALEMTDRHARYAVLFWSAQRKENENALRIDAEVKGRDIDAARLREAQLSDRPAAMAAARETEEGHIRMILACRASNDFARQPAQAGGEAYGLISPNVGRRPLAIEAGRRRLNQDRADLHFDHRNVPHEEAAVYPQGSYWQEVSRQRALKADEGAPKLLRNLQISPFSASVDTIARSYGGADSGQLQEANTAFVKLLDARIAELDARLNGTVEYKGRKVPVRLFGKSTDPRAHIVVAAEEALALAKNLRREYTEKAGTDLFSGSMRQTPKESIMMVEIAIASLSDENFNFPPGKELEAALTPSVNRITVQPINVPGYGTVSHGFFRADVLVASGEAKQRRGESPLEYAARTGEELNLTYDWMFTSELRQDYFLVANPNSYRKGHENEPAYVARIMRNMPERLPDGRTAYPVIAARPPEKATQSQSRSTTLDYELETNADGSYKILAYVTEKRGPEGRPIFVPASAQLSEEARQRLFRTDCGAMIAQPMAGDMQASVIVRQK